MSIDQNGQVRLATAFSGARTQGRPALITYLTAGYPDLEESPRLIRVLQEGGADIIELGVPFSDPVADGPTIQAASQAALQAGVTPKVCLELVAEVRAGEKEGDRVSVPIVLMGYYNPILSYGVERYVQDCARVGVDGLIVPDLPPEEAGPLRSACTRHGVALVFLVAPTTGEARLEEIARATQGFLYVVSRLGTTGSGPSLDEGVISRLELARKHARTPVAVGFGISRPEQARRLAPYADGIIVGSAIVRRATEGTESLRAFVSELRSALEP